MGNYTFVQGRFVNGERTVTVLDGYDPAQDSVTELEDGIFLMERTFSIREDQPAPERLRLEIVTAGKARFTEIPCVSYDGNPWGSHVEPQGDRCSGQPWVYASHRSSLPGCTYSENEQDAVCLFGDPENPDFSMSLYQEMDSVRQSLILPQEETPVRYVAKALYDGPHKPKLFLDGSVTLRAYVVLNPIEKKGVAIRKALRFGWKRFAHEVKPRFDAEKLWELGVRFARESVYYEEDGYRGFCMGLYYDAGRWIQRRDHLEIGWVGQNASTAVSLLRHALETGDSALLNQATGVLDNWLNARMGNGLFHCYYDYLLPQCNGMPLPERQDPANLFSVVRQYLLAYHLLEEAGICKPEYRETALAVCRFALGAQLEDGTFPRGWLNDGTACATDGTAGAYMVWALLCGYEETKDIAMLDAARRSFDAYLYRFEEDGYMTAGALDTCCIDKESAMPMLAVAVLLYEHTKDERYLSCAQEISVYLETWLYHYSVRFPSGTLLQAYGYDTLGGTSVSTQHQHIDGYALLFVPFWLKLSQYTGDAFWEELAWAIWCNATQFVSDGTLVIDGVRRPAGSQDEGVNHTFWHTSRGEFFHTSRWLVCWNNAFRLEGLRDAHVCSMLAGHS